MIDAPIPGTLSGFLFTLTELTSAIIVIAVSSPLFLAFILPLALLYLVILRSLQNTENFGYGDTGYGDNRQILRHL